MGLHIVATGRCLPKKQLTNDMLSEMVETNDEWIRTRTGIHNRYQCEEESCVSLAAGAAAQAYERSGIAKDEIAVVIVASTTSDDMLPSAASMVAQRLELPEEILSFDISTACTGFLTGLAVARGLLLTSTKKYALVIGSEQLSRIVDYTDRGTCILFGDGAGAAVVELSDKPYLQKSWTRGNREMLYCAGVGQETQRIVMQGTEVFKFAVKVLQQGIDEILQEAQLTLSDIDFVICHQANERIIRHVQKKYKGLEDKFYINIADYGNTSAASIPIALDELVSSGRLREGMRILCVAFGAGLTWNSVYMEW
ncbi:MAG: ketoacyl-ACP synthase III [Lachnospiraceae bacterium]|nr:ketoacyl-ACP synthase III [Lachnospiraceae bacterium]